MTIKSLLNNNITNKKESGDASKNLAKLIQLTTELPQLTNELQMTLYDIETSKKQLEKLLKNLLTEIEIEKRDQNKLQIIDKHAKNLKSVSLIDLWEKLSAIDNSLNDLKGYFNNHYLITTKRNKKP